MNGYAREERELIERDFEDDLRAATRARTVDHLHDLHLSFATVAEALRRRAISEQETPVSAPAFTPDCERDDFGVIVDCDEKRRCVGYAGECAEEATCALFDARCAALWETQECDGRCARCGAGAKG